MKTIERRFDSIYEFIKFITNIPINKVFKNVILYSKENNEYFTGTKSFNEALDLLKNGWDEMAKKVEKLAQLKLKDIGVKNQIKTYYDVVGFQPSVPRYLQGIPTNMVNKKNVKQKVKVLTLLKNIEYPGNTSIEDIINNSIKAFQIIRALEAKGIRINLEVFSYVKVRDYSEEVIVRVKIKDANERLNISKMVFPLIHPSMLRRIMFRELEVEPEINSYGWRDGYGIPITKPEEVQKKLKSNEYCLPSFINDVDEVIKMLENN